MEDLLKQQAATAASLQRVVENFRKDPVQRKTNAYFEERLRRLEEQWAIFESTDTQLRELPTLETSHQYFAEDVYSSIRNIYENYESIFSTQIRLLEGIENSQQNDNQPADGDNKADGGSTTDAKANKGSPSGTKHHQASINTNSQSARSIDLTIAVRRQLQMFDALCRMLNRIDLDQPSKAYAELKASTLQRMWGQIEEQHLTICSYADDPEQHNYDFNQYIALEERVQMVLVQLSEGRQTKANIVDIKLPRVTLTKFDGDYGNWIQFRDLFKQMIHDQPMAECQKLWYLKTSVVGEAAKLISHLTTSAENYAAAWQILEDRFENKRLLIAVLINKLLLQPSQSNDSPSFMAIKTLHDVTKECLLGLKNLGVDTDTWDPILVHLMLKKLDRTTHTLFEQSLDNPKEAPKIQQLMGFLENRFQSLEALGGAKRTINNNKPHVKALASVLSHCACCNGQHPLFACKPFLKLTVKERLHVIKKNNLCINCLKPGHRRNECSSTRCPKCQKKHNSLIHFEGSRDHQTVKQNPRVQDETPETVRERSSISLTTSSAVQQGYVILNTAWIHLATDNGTTIKCRAILDSGSQINIITDRLARKLGVTSRTTSLQIEGIGNSRHTASKRTSLLLLADNFSQRLEAYVLATIVPPQPAQKIDTARWRIPHDIVLADPGFHTPGHIDVLLGAEFYHQVLKAGQIKLANGLPILQNTVFGWVVAGKIQDLQQNSATCGVSLTNDDLSGMLDKFWQLEEFQSERHQLTSAERWCETHFMQTTTRTNRGRFVVKLPFATEPSSLGESKDIALRRFLSLERRLQRNPQLHQEYAAFMKEYEELGHMQEIDMDSIHAQHYFLPHHCVIKPESTTTKLRVVFDASAKTSKNLSLNDILHTGPTIQDELWIIMLRFRLPQYVFSADIQKMYRQILIHQEHLPFQLIFWRTKPSDPLKCYALKTVTYGMSSAPYLAMKSLAQLAKTGEVKYPLGARILQSNCYVDNTIAGMDSLYEAVESQKQLIALLAEAGFKLRKWSSNHPKLLEGIPPEDQEAEVSLYKNEGGIQTLGLIWIPTTDMFKIKLNIEDQTTVTKRTITADLARIFDPLGLVAPATVTAKIIIQDVTKLNTEWDTPVPQHIRTRWEEFKEGLETLSEIKIPGHVFDNKTHVNT